MGLGNVEGGLAFLGKLLLDKVESLAELSFLEGFGKELDIDLMIGSVLIVCMQTFWLGIGLFQGNNAHICGRCLKF